VALTLMSILQVTCSYSIKVWSTSQVVQSNAKYMSKHLQLGNKYS